MRPRTLMRPGQKTGKRLRQLTSLFLALALLTCSVVIPGGNWVKAADELSGNTVQPLLVVTGTGIIDGGYTLANISHERSYTLDELQAMTDLVENNFYSTINSFGTKRIYAGDGISIEGLLAQSGFTMDADSELSIRDGGSGSISFDDSRPLTGRNYYPNIGTGFETDSEAVGAILAWANSRADQTGDTPVLPPATQNLSSTDLLTLMAGQLNIADVNNSLFWRGARNLTAGDVLSDSLITIDEQDYTRSEILMMERADRSYTYTTRSGEQTDYVRGVPLAVLVEGHEDDEIISFTVADDYDMSSASVTVADAIANNYLLGFEKGSNADDLAGILDTAKFDPNILGYFTLYGDGIKPSKLIDSITITASENDYTNSPYKHINNGGLPGSAPYNIDAITGATLTVEGPGVESTTPIRMYDLESTDNDNIYRGQYADVRAGNPAEFKYEGVTVLSIIDGLVNDGVEKVDDNVQIIFKNRWRQDVGYISYSDLADAAAPVILAYGTGTLDETSVAPFVFDGDPGIIPELENDDGCVKLVYDQSEFPTLSTSPNFSSVAYIYVEQGGEPPGYKHSTATDEAYKNVANTEQLITFTGTALGREVNYTVSELEAMVIYGIDDGLPESGGLGHRAEYNLSNTTYWYVNEYEGLKLWDLLTTRLGLSAATYANDENTLVSFAAWDNYQTTAQFSMAQLADPDRFYFYEKSPLDIGTSRPTKEQLATPEYQPDNTLGDWATDSNGYPVKKGYPVMLAYGINGYPYVRDSSLPGYAGGLGNDGGPMRVIFGKTDGMNRSNPSALENYGYFYNNGSNQLQRAQEIYVGDDKRYSTHLENPAYTAMADTTALTVDVVQGGVTTSKTYTLAQLESLLYGAGVAKGDMEKEGRQEKGYYAHKVYDGALVEDLFEGVNLWYLLSEDVGMQGVLGNVSLYTGSSETSALDLTLSDLQTEGFNSLRNTDGLGMMVAFAKNGYPLVLDKNAAGYVKDDIVTGKTIKNSDGPLMFVRSQTEAEKNAAIPGATVTNLTKIVINLEADTYAHSGDYAAYGDAQLAFSGAVKNNGVTLTVADIEKLQKYMVTGSYTIGEVAQTYRGIDLGKLLSDSSVGASALLSQATVSNGASASKTVTVADMSGDKPIILAYGIGKEGGDPAGKPLVPDATSSGYDAAYLNSGGPLRLIIDGADEADCIQNVTTIEVTAAELSGWTHSSGYYEAYKDKTLGISGSNSAQSLSMTVEQVEALSDTYKVFDQYKMGNYYYFEGVDLLKLLRDHVGFSGGLQSSNITVYAKDNYAINFTATDLSNGVNGKPIILAYGQGTSPDHGLPLVDGNDTNDVRDGFDPSIGNAFGPLRLVVNDNTGWCNKWVTAIVVGSGSVEPPASHDFVLTNGSEATDYDISDIKSISAGSGGQATSSYLYTSGGVLKTDYVKGILLADLLADADISGDQATVTINCTDGYESKQASYRDIPLADISSKNYFLAYDAGEAADARSAILDKDEKQVEATVRIYRNYDDGSTWMNRLTSIMGITVTGAGSGGEDYTFTIYPGSGKSGELPMASVRDVVPDTSGGLWVGTNGGGAWYKPAAGDEFTINTLNSAGYVLQSDLVYAIAIDDGGGIWFTQSKTYNPAQASLNKGVAYLKDGNIVYYNTDTPGTIPNNYVQEVRIDASGNVWFGSFGGLTRYNPGTGIWTTWNQSYADGNGDHFPAASVDNLICDGQGGVWLGFYPSGAGTEADPFVGGFAHMTADGDITPYQFTGDYDSDLGSSLLSQVWVRDIAVDGNGGAWVVAAGSYTDLANVGGNVWHVDTAGSATKFTGNELLGAGRLTNNGEIRMVNVDPDGGLWLGTSADGLYYIADPGSSAPVTITTQFNGDNGAWPDSAQFNNIYAMDIIDGMIYLGSDGGVMTAALADIAPSDPGGGGGDPGDYDLTIDGAGVKNTTYYSIDELKNSSELETITASYNWLNSFGTTGSDQFEGVYLEDLLGAAGLKASAESVTVTASDGYYRSFNLDDNDLGVYWTDIQGHQIMLAWKKNGSDCPLQLVVGQTDANHVNKPMWVSDIVTLTVETSSTEPGSGSAGGYSPPKSDASETGVLKPDLTIQGDKALGTVTGADIKEALEALRDDAANPQAPLALLIDAVSNSPDVNQTEVILSAEAIKALAEAGNVTVTIKTQQGLMELTPAVLQFLAEGLNAPIRIVFSDAAASGLDAAGQALIGTRPIVDVTIFKGSQEVTDLGGNQLKIMLPYTISANESPDLLLIYYINAQGQAVPVLASMYDPEQKALVFGTNHLSQYAVGFNNVKFDDILGSWAKGNIEFLAARGIVSGRAPGVFVPDGNVTRAEFLTILANSVPGLNIQGAPSANFSDVPASAWYADVVNWGVSQGIVSGYGDGRFGPDDLITREQVAVMLDNYIKAMQSELEIVEALQPFADQTQISDWAAAAVGRMQQFDIINGRDANMFAPQANCTRAEAATLIKGYVERQLGL